MSKKTPGYWKAKRAILKAAKAELYGPPAPQTAAYQRTFVIPLEEGLALIEKGKQIAKVEMYGVTLSIQSSGCRLLTFLKSLTCASCGAIGTHFAAERRWHDKCGYHMNLWGKAADGSPLLFTHDHITPRSKGGINTVANSQTMCVTCNEHKGDSV